MLVLLLLSTPSFAQSVGDLKVGLANGTGRIYLDGRDTGVDAPATLPSIEAGNHVVQVKGNCVGAFSQVDVAPGRVNEVALTLAPMGGFAEISVVPEFASVTLDGRPIVTPANEEMTCGNHTLIASAPGYVPETRALGVEMGGAYRFRVELLKDGFGSVNVSTNQPKARVYIDGASVAVGSQTINQVPAGHHTVKAELDGYTTVERQIAVEGGSIANVQLDLVASNGASNGGAGPKPPTQRNTRALAGGGIALAGVGLAVGGVAAYTQARTTYQNEYAPLVEDDYEAASELYRNEIRPKANLGYALMVVGGVAVAGGGTLIFIDDHGAYLGFTRQF